MLSLRHIERMVESKAYPRLVQRILANGRCESPRAIQRLLEPRAVSLNQPPWVSPSNESWSWRMGLCRWQVN